MRKRLTQLSVAGAMVLGHLAFGAGAATAAGPCVGCGPSVHVVQPGEWLWKIAREDLAARGINAGEQSFVRNRANAIYNRNRALIGSNPNLIRPGMRLALPPL
jgi:nucleoid-associated protein YgaU